MSRRATELFELLLKRLDNFEARLAGIEAGQTLMRNAIDRHSRAITDANRRCMEKLGQCPLDEDEDPNHSA